MKNAIVYLRRSTKKEEQEKSIPDQLAEVKAQARREGWHLVEELLHRYIDDGISGRSKKDRQGFLQILEDAKSGLLERYGVEAVLYWATDRLARNTLNALEIQDELEEYGIKLYSVTERYDLSTDSGRIQFIMCSMFAEERSNQISRDTKRGLKQKALRGEYGCPAQAIGYKRDNDRNLVIDEEHAPTVKLMFKLAGEGVSAARIARQLNKLGLRTRSGNRWSRKVVIGVLRNRLYIGEIVYGRSYATRKGKVVFRPEDEWEIIPGKHEAIVERELFEKVQRLLDGRKADKNLISQRRHFYLLSGLGILKCRCGDAFIGHTIDHRIKGKIYRYQRYRCNSRETRQGKCGTPSVRCEVLDTIVINDIKRYVKNPDRIRAEYQRNRKMFNANAEALKDKLSHLDSNIKRVELKIDRLLTGYEAGVIELQDYERRSKHLRDERFRCQVQKLELESLLEKAPRLPDEDKIIAQLGEFLKVWENGSNQQKRMLIKELVNEIIVEGKNEFTIRYNFLP